MSKDVELHGWIQPCDPDLNINTAEKELQTLGVDVGPWNTIEKEFQHCVVSLAVLAKLDPLWGRYIWGLSHD